MKLIKLILVIVSFAYAVNVSSQTTNISYTSDTTVVIQNRKGKLTNLKSWYYKDILLDTIPGISLEKAYKDIIKDKKGDTIIVAVLDSGFDIIHSELKESIWVNKDEIPDNKLDDDHNGYVDDVHGWNFIGKSDGTNLMYTNWEFVRFLRKYQSYFETKDTTNLKTVDQQIFRDYKRAKRAYAAKLVELENDKKEMQDVIDEQQSAKEVISKYYPNGEYTLEDLYKIDPKGDEELKQHLLNRIKGLYYDLEGEWLREYRAYLDPFEKYKLNFNFIARDLIGDDLNDFKDSNYGNNDVIGDLALEAHGTNVAGIIAANRVNNIGIKGITNLVKIMPIRVVPRGDEYDKDVALAIKYAVDNGAKIINMSFGKEFSIHPEFVWDAIAYAAKKEVLLVSAAGNLALNIDKNNYYPSDGALGANSEITDNFMKIGATTHHLDGNIVADFSNYGKSNVDLFAPGDEIYTTSPHDQYESDGGTSFSSPIVSGIAALIWSFYPELSASEVKEILMKSGVFYDINVDIEENSEKKTVPFSELSKSGKVVNAYNALQLAEKIYKTKHK